jgi:4-hydroxybenzoate polyprenyltransferase
MTGSATSERAGRPPLLTGLAAACHPAPSLAVTTVTVVLAAGVGLRAGLVVLLGAAVFTGQLSIGWSNDRIDAARDRATGRTDKPTATGRVPVDAVAVAAGVALLATLILSALLPFKAAIAALLLVAAGWAYNLGLKGTVLSGAAYVVGFGALPAAPYLAEPGHPWPPWWVPVVGALLGLGAHFANVLPDLKDDAATGVRGLPHRLGPRLSVITMAACLAAASVVLAFGPDSVATAVAVSAAGVGLLAAVVAAVAALRAPDSPLAFRCTMAIAVLDVGLLIVIAS